MNPAAPLRRLTTRRNEIGRLKLTKFALSRRALFWDVAAFVAVAALAFGAYLSIPQDGQSFGGSGVTARGTITAIDPVMRVVTIYHDRVEALSAPQMIMDFGLEAQVDITSIRVGAKVAFTLTRRAGELYIIGAIKPTM